MTYECEICHAKFYDSKKADQHRKMPVREDDSLDGFLARAEDHIVLYLKSDKVNEEHQRIFWGSTFHLPYFRDDELGCFVPCAYVATADAIRHRLQERLINALGKEQYCRVVNQVQQAYPNKEFKRDIS